MPDTLGFRMKFGITTPSTNTIVQPEYDDLRPHGVTNHLGRMHIPPMAIRTAADFDESIRLIAAALDEAVDRVMTCDPGYLILGISAVSVAGGSKASSDAMRERMRQRAGRHIGVSHAGDALPAALKAYGLGPGARIAMFDPYFPSIEGPQRSFFKEHGYEVVRVKHLQGASPVLYAHTSVAEMIDTVHEIDGKDVDVIIQFGANLPFARLAGEAERWLRKPVISVNSATYWHACRQTGILDRRYDYGRLWSEF